MNKIGPTLPLLAALCALTGSQPRLALALEAEALTGHWEGTAEGSSFEGAIGMFVELWMEEGKLVGWQGCDFGVSEFDSIKIRGDKLHLAFYIPQVGPAILVGEVDEKKVYRFRWQVSDGSGEGRVARVDMEKAAELDPKELTGRFVGTASGPLVEDTFEVTADLKAEAGKLTGSIVSPDGVFKIARGSYTKNRFRLVCRGPDEMKALVLGKIEEGKITAFWTAGPEAGKLALDPR